MKFLILLAQYHLDFRLAELNALADLFGISVSFDSYDPSVCFAIDCELSIPKVNTLFYFALSLHSLW